MSKRNKTSNINYRFLSAKHFDELYQVNLKAFSDYLIPIRISEIQFENHIAQNAVDLNLSVGAFAEGKMVGFTLNGFGLWNGKQTAYDAGTGVIPDFRKRGVGRSMFDFLLPKLREIGTEQMLLEVIEGNEIGIRLYQKLGFEKTRKLLFFEQGESLDLKRNENIEIRELEDSDWNLLENFWDRNTSWQFSWESILRKTLSKTILGAFLDENIVGYGVVYPTSGMIPQIAVDKNCRRKGVASTILYELREHAEKDKKLKFSNVDESLVNVIEFVKRLDFKQTITQFEMIKTL
jgi:ribosomal protein S18 acetylase RimI-like enzyme